MKRNHELIRNFCQLYSLKLAELGDIPRPQAYEATEEAWIKTTGERFYKNYNTFQASRSRFINVRTGKRF